MTPRPTWTMRFCSYHNAPQPDCPLCKVAESLNSACLTLDGEWSDYTRDLQFEVYDLRQRVAALEAQDTARDLMLGEALADAIRLRRELTAAQGGKR